jgi:hypothetical protein
MSDLSQTEEKKVQPPVAGSVEGCVEKEAGSPLDSRNAINTGKGVRRCAVKANLNISG